MPVNARSLTLSNLRHQFGVQLNSSDRFFSDWLSQSPALSASDLQALDRLQRNYDYLSQEEPPLEEVVKLVVVSPLFDLAGFYQPPFLIKTEIGTSIEVTDDPDLSIQSKIDILVIQDALWVLVIESKPARLDVTVGIPQALTYLLSAPTQQSILYSMVTNGREVLFLRFDRTTTEYSRSPTYRLLETAQERQQILQGLKVISSLIQN